MVAMVRLAVLLMSLCACGGNGAAIVDAVQADAPSTDAEVAVDAEVAIDAAPPSVTSIRVGADATFESFAAVAVTSDGTVIVGGTAAGAGGLEAVVVTFDAADQLTGVRTLGTGESDSFLGAASDGAGAVLVGTAGQAQQLGIAVRVAADRTVTAARTFGGSQRAGNTTTRGGQALNAVARTASGYVLAGETYPGSTAASGASWVLALDDQLAPRWEYTAGDGVGRIGAGAAAARAGRLFVGGYAHTSADAAGMRIVAFDDGATATPAWIRQLAPILAGGFDLDNVTAIAATADGLWLAGYADPGGVFTGQILKLGLDGTVMGGVRLEGPGNPILRAVVALADGGCVVAGDAGGHGLLVRVDAALQVVWQQSVGTAGASRLAAAAAAPDGSVVFAGTYANDGWLLRVHGLAAAPPFGTPGTAGVVSESPTSIANPTVAVAAWSSTSAAWAPAVVDRTDLPVRAAD